MVGRSVRYLDGWLGLAVRDKKRREERRDRPLPGVGPQLKTAPGLGYDQSESQSRPKLAARLSNNANKITTTTTSTLTPDTLGDLRYQIIQSLARCI